jgi:hypothetical protein
MFRRKKNIKCETKDEIICFTDKSPTGTPTERLKESSKNPRDSPSGKNFRELSDRRLVESLGRNPRESLSPNGARAQRSGSFEKLSGLLGPEVIADIKKLSMAEELPEIN